MSVADATERLKDHVERTIGEIEGIWAQIVPGVVRTDVIVAGARTLVSTGMSSQPVPGTDGRERTELTLQLPPDWPMQMDDESHWPFALLQNVAAYPHATGVGVGPWETLAFAEPPEPLGPGTPFVGCMAAPPQLLEDAATRFELEPGVAVSLLGLVPLHADELAFARTQGAMALADALLAAGVTERLDPDRPSVIGAALEGLERPEKVDDELAALPALLYPDERPELLARAQLGMFDRGLLALTDRRLLLVVSRHEDGPLIDLPRAELETLWGHDQYLVVRGGDVRETLVDVHPRERVAELSVIGPAPEAAAANAQRLAAMADEALGRMTRAAYGGRLAELAVELAPDEALRFMDDGKLEGANGLIVLTDQRLYFRGEAIRRAKRREETVAVERIRSHTARTGLRASLTLVLDDGRELELKLGRSELKRLSEALPS